MEVFILTLWINVGETLDTWDVLVGVEWLRRVESEIFKFEIEFEFEIVLFEKLKGFGVFFNGIGIGFDVWKLDELREKDEDERFEGEEEELRLFSQWVGQLVEKCPGSLHNLQGNLLIRSGNFLKHPGSRWPVFLQNVQIGFSDEDWIAFTETDSIEPTLVLLDCEGCALGLLSE